VKIALVRLSSLGDIIFCMAALQVIKRALPDSSITFFADSKFADILDHNPDLHRVVKLDLKGIRKGFTWKRFSAEYRKLADPERFDMAIDLHGMLKSAIVARKVGVASFGFHRSVVKERWATFCYDRTAAPLLPVHRYALLAAQALGITLREEDLVDKRPFLFYSPADRQASDPYFPASTRNVLLIPGSSLETKNYPVEKLVTLCDGLRENILLCHGNEQELQIAQRVAAATPHAIILPRLNLNQLKAAISRADLVIGGDTGPTHIAWANNVPSVSLFGPTPPCIHPSALNRIVLPAAGVGRPVHEIAVSDILRHAGELLAGR
jgi:heptosyltransferase I